MKRKDRRRVVRLIRHIKKNLPFFSQLLGIYYEDLSKIRHIDQDVINLYGGMKKVSDDWDMLVAVRFFRMKGYRVIVTPDWARSSSYCFRHLIFINTTRITIEEKDYERQMD